MNKLYLYITVIVVIAVLYKYVYKPLFMNVLSNLDIRKCDAFGCGYFGASRGARKHTGIDLVTKEGQNVYSNITGYVNRYVIPYGSGIDANILQGVEIIGTGKFENYKLKILYVKPSVAVGFPVIKGTKIGTAQTLQNRYKGITEHIHYELYKNGVVINPNELLKM